MKRNFSIITKIACIGLCLCCTLFSLSAGAQGKKHLVKPGETFYHIATEYGVKVADLQKANPSVTTLKAGQELVIPEGGKPLAKLSGAESVTPPANEKTASAGKAPAKEKTVATNTGTTDPAKMASLKEEPTPTRGYHTVKAKETIASIAKDFGVTETDLKKWNPDAAKGIKPGMSLKVIEL